MQGNKTTRHASFGPYEIRTTLGQGGGGHVYRAWDPRLQREVALKILRERPDADPDRVRRFVFEARAASALNHPNIVTVFDAAVDGDTPYIVSELVDGTTLRDEMRRGPVAVKRLLDLATQIAEGLAAAHDAGIVHRDLKPENIMVTRTGRAKILDFGLAWSGEWQVRTAETPANDGQTQTELGLRAGTIPYMSPEQARGAASDFRSDQFSLGLILYEMAAGRPAFRRDTPAATLDAIVKDEPPMSALDARTPLLLRWIIERCLAKEAGDRYGSTADLHRDLRTLRDRLAETVARESGAVAPQRATTWRRALTAGAMLTALAAGVMLGGRVVEPQPFNRLLTHAPLATAPGYEGFPAWSRDGHSIAYSAEVNGVLQIFQRDPLASAPSQVTDKLFDCKYPFWSRDGKRIYFVSRAKLRDAIWSVPAGGGEPVVVVLDAIRGAISPDGRTLAFLREREGDDIVGSMALYLARPAGAEPWSMEAVETAATGHASLASQSFVEGALSFSPDGTRLGLYVVNSFYTLTRSDPTGEDLGWWNFWIVPLSGGEPYRLLDRMRMEFAPWLSSFTWMPDSRHVVLGLISLSTYRSSLWMADLERDRAWSITSTSANEEYPSASHAGNELVYTKDDSDYDVVEIAFREKTLRPILQSLRSEKDPVWSRDGRFAYVTDRGGQDEIWLRDREGLMGDRPLVTQRNFGEGDRTIMLRDPSFSPDGQKIAYLRTGMKPIWPLRIWHGLVGGGTASPLLPVATKVYQTAPSWSADGLWIVFAERSDRTWRLVKVRVGTDERVELRSNGVSSAAPQWSPANDWITWETETGVVLVSPDGTRQQDLTSEGGWHAHTWARDGSAVFGIRETDDRRLVLEAVAVRQGGRTRVIADLGPSPPANAPVRGLSVSPDGQTVVTSLLRQRGDLWLLKGLQPQERPFWSRLFRQFP
jgi:Tol biopolymer transport system component